MTARIRTLLALVALVALAGLTLACGAEVDEGSGGRSGPTGTGGAQKHTGETSGAAGTSSAAGTAVTIQDERFVPRTLSVRVGTTVTWTNDDTVAHTVTGDGFDSGPIEPSGTYSRKFDRKGTYPYRCTIHPSMQGEIAVR